MFVCPLPAYSGSYANAFTVFIERGLNACNLTTQFDVLCWRFFVLCLFSLQNGLNALHLAAKEGHKDLVEELLERGAPVDSSTKVHAHVHIMLVLSHYALSTLQIWIYHSLILSPTRGNICGQQKGWGEDNDSWVSEGQKEKEGAEGKECTWL